MIAGNLSPAEAALSYIPLSIRPRVGMSREVGTTFSLANTGQKQAFHTQRDMLSQHWKNAVCLLPEPHCAFTMQMPLEESSFLSAIWLQKGLHVLLSPYKCLTILSKSQTDRSCYFTSTHWGKPQENIYLSINCNSRAISRPHAILRYYLSTQTHKSPRSIFSEVDAGLQES